MEKSLGMIIGRFQHLHIGHVAMIEKGLEACDKILLFVGSAQESQTQRNPFSCSIRTNIIEQSFKKEIQDGRLYVGSIKDLTNEDDHSLEWGDYVLKQVNELRNQFNISEPLKYMVYGNDEERQSWYREDNIVDVQQLVLERATIPISATKMRGFLVEGNKELWLSYMPSNRLSVEKLNSLYEELRNELLQLEKKRLSS